MDRKELEEELVQKLTEGEMETQDAEEAARKRLPFKTEIRILAETDPLVEETKRYRQIADEVDTRYDRYDKLVQDSQQEQ
jgi:23S rRNA A2030 N6-methylase RlmJ